VFCGGHQQPVNRDSKSGNAPAFRQVTASSSVAASCGGLANELIKSLSTFLCTERRSQSFHVVGRMSRFSQSHRRFQRQRLEIQQHDTVVGNNADSRHYFRFRTLQLAAM
jgi:hypothetical protein